MGENGFKMKEGGFRMGIRKKNLFPLMVVRPWKRFPRVAVAATSLEAFQTWLDRTWSNLV